MDKTSMQSGSFFLCFLVASLILQPSKWGQDISLKCHELLHGVTIQTTAFFILRASNLTYYTSRCYPKFLDCYCCNCLSESRWKEKPRPHFHMPIASVCHVTPRCEHTLFLYECFFDFMFRFVCDGWQNRAMCLHQVLCEARQISY
jgi:hypothetical protein